MLSILQHAISPCFLDCPVVCFVAHDQSSIGGTGKVTILHRVFPVVSSSLQTFLTFLSLAEERLQPSSGRIINDGLDESHRLCDIT